MPYVSHSFNQFILPVENGFVFADHGDAYPRSFTFARFLKGANTKRRHAFTFPGGIGSNPTYAEMGGLAKTAGGYIFVGTYGRIRNNPRNLFILILDGEFESLSAPVYLTRYAKEDGHAGHPKIVGLGGGRFLVLWERFEFSTQPANVIESVRSGYLSTHCLIINERGEALSEVKELTGPAVRVSEAEGGSVSEEYEAVRLNMNDTLRYNPVNGRVYWAVNHSPASITLYTLDPALPEGRP